MDRLDTFVQKKHENRNPEFLSEFLGEKKPGQNFPESFQTLLSIKSNENLDPVQKNETRKQKPNNPVGTWILFALQ